MIDGIKTALAILGIIGIVVAGYALYDRFYQHPKPNIARFYDSRDDPPGPRRITSLDPSGDKLLEFLRGNVQKRVYVDITFEPESGIKTDPINPPESDKPFEFSYQGDCRKYPVPKNKAVEYGCNEIVISLDPAKDVEQQVFHPYAYDFQVRGYFLVSSIESHMGVQFLSLKPISAQQILT